MSSNYTKTSAVTSQINCHLLHCAALLESLSCPVSASSSLSSAGSSELPCDPTIRPGILASALSEADAAMQIAQTYHRPEFEPRAQLYRGHCLRAMRQWPAALDCYARAASLDGPGCAELGNLTRLCREMVEAEHRKAAQRRDARLALEGITEKDADRLGAETESLSSWLSLESGEGSEDEVEHDTRNVFVMRDGDGKIVRLQKALPRLRSVRGLQFEGPKSIL